MSLIVPATSVYRASRDVIKQVTYKHHLSASLNNFIDSKRACLCVAFCCCFLFHLYHVTHVQQIRTERPGCQCGFCAELLFPVRLLTVFCHIVSPFPSRPTDSSFLRRLWVSKFKSNQSYKMAIYQLLCSHNQSISVSCFHSCCKLNSCKLPPHSAPQRKGIAKTNNSCDMGNFCKTIQTCSFQKPVVCFSGMLNHSHNVLLHD